ncbi:unnamed protein product [Ilex paraguariensis]|uniref:Uncharacterized protein n=1 Tax=Ilex paraguariensis TaxID=185542 RepID=A0ABC8V1I4_9AQUA
MKHIFKKLHHNRSNDTPPLTASSSSLLLSGSSDTRTTSSGQTSGQPPASPSTSSSPSTATVPVTAANSLTTSAVNRQDYFSSEEEYQVQLALALSVSSGHDARDDSEKDQIRAATFLSLGGQNRGDTVRERGEAAADLLSRQYWLVYCVLVLSFGVDSLGF